MLPVESQRSSKSNTTQNQIIITKKLIVDEYKNRLKDNINSLNGNLLQILQCSKINLEESNIRNNIIGKMAELNTTRCEISTRAALMTKATDELLLLTNDIREFLILRDFNFLSNSITNIEKTTKSEIEQHKSSYNDFRLTLSLLITEIDKEIIEHFSLRF